MTICAAAVLTLGLAACGGGGSDTADTMPPVVEPEPTPYEVASAAIAAAGTEAEARAAVAAAVAAGISGAQLQSLNMAVDERVMMLAAAAAAAERAALVAAAMCEDATAECLAAHNALVTALQGDVADLAADETATNAQQNAAQMALDEAEADRDAVQMAISEIDRTTVAGREVGEAIDAANGLETDRSADAIAAAKVAIEEAEQAVGDDDSYDVRIAMAKTAVARAEERNAVDAAVMAAEAAAIGLADDSSVDAVTAAQGLVDAANMAIMDAEHLTDAEKATETAKVTAAQGTVTVAKNDNDAEAERIRLAEEKAAQEKAAEQAKADKAMAAKLYAGLGEDSTTLDNATISITRAGLVADNDSTAGTDADLATLKATTSTVPSYGAWSGTDYVRTTSTVTDHSVIYNNRDAPKMELFATKYATQLAEDTNNGRLNNAFLILATSASLIASSDFASGSGFVDHTEQANDVVKIRGSFNGGMGYYHCEHGTSACRSAVNGSGGITLSGAGGWSFEPDDNTMAVTPDAAYLVFGWWSREVATGVDVATFAQRVGDATGTDLAGAANTALIGTATYTGGAAGKYSINEPVDGDPNSGAFTAAATLTAKFGNATVPGTISGMLTNFMAGGEAKDWSVALVGAGTAAEAAIAATGAGSANGFGTPETPAPDGTNTARTIWTINGDAGSRSGSWSGDFYYETATQQTAANTPPSAAGTFTANHGNVGRMVGAFGVEKQ